MPAKPRSTPGYCLHKPTGRAYVRLNGRAVYLGAWNTPESRAEYDRVIAEWLTAGRSFGLQVAPSDLTVNELIAAYWKHVEAYYRKDGRPTSEVSNIRLALRPAQRLYGNSAARQFGPTALKACRSAMIDAGHVRTAVNRDVFRIRLMFKWGVAQELIPPSILEGLRAVESLRAGRTAARESAPVRAVDEQIVEAVKPYIADEVWAMIQLQLLTGMRPGEVTIMRGCDLDTRGKIWLYRPRLHKTEHHGKERVVEAGPKAQKLIQQFLRTDLACYLFRPADAEQRRRQQRHAQRKTPLHYGNRPGTNRRAKPKRQPGDHYDVSAYRRAIARACDTAFPLPAELATIHESDRTEEQKEAIRRWRQDHRWHPHQLRHTFATRVREHYGLEAARAMLGQTTVAAAQIYAEIDRKKCADIAMKIG